MPAEEMKEIYMFWAKGMGFLFFRSRVLNRCLGVLEWNFQVVFVGGKSIDNGGGTG